MNPYPCVISMTLTSELVNTSSAEKLIMIDLVVFEIWQVKSQGAFI